MDLPEAVVAGFSFAVLSITVETPRNFVSNLRSSAIDQLQEWWVQQLMSEQTTAEGEGGERWWNHGVWTLNSWVLIKLNVLEDRFYEMIAKDVKSSDFQERRSIGEKISLEKKCEQ